MFTRCFSPHIILYCVFSIFCLGIFGQDQSQKSTSALSAKVSVNRSRILLGEQFELRMQLEVLSGSPVLRWPQLPDSLGHFEILERSALDSVLAGNNMTYSQTLTLTSFDSGRWVIPAMSFMAGNKLVKSDSLAIDVANVVLKGNDYNDIKEIIEVPEPGFDWKIWLPYIIGTVLVLALISYWLMNRKKKPVIVEKPVSRSTAYEQAMADLKKLKAEQLPEKGEMKQYYSRLYDIYRIYLGRYTGINMMQSTTDDILINMKDTVPVSGFSRMAEVLRISDAVKFAKYSSSVQESTGAWDTIFGLVEELNKQKS